MTTEADPTQDESVARPSPTFADRLNWCFEVRHPRDRGPWTPKEVSEQIFQQDNETTCSDSYLSQLRLGQKDNPTLDQLKALAEVFHVPVVYFFGSASPVEADQTQDEAVAMSVSTFADRLNRCFEVMHPRDRGSWSTTEVSEAIAAQDNKTTCSISFLTQLRNGEKKANPTYGQLKALAEVFHVPVVYFVGSAAEVEWMDAQLDLLEAVRRAEVRDVLMRASSLSSTGLKALTAFINQIVDIPGMAEPAPDKPRRRRRKPIPPPAGPDQSS